MRRRPALASSLVLSAVALLGSGSNAEATYSLVWSDEFNGTSLNLSDWNYDIGTGCPNLCGWGNNELQYYRSQNVSVGGGNLTITARQESFGGQQYTSGKITTKGKQFFKYGRFEIRAKLPTGGGMWPAFWMLSEDDAYGGWASSGEIDIMESANETTSIGGTLHFGGSWPNNTYSGSSYQDGGNFADGFRVYAIEWEEDVMRWYVDDALYSTRTSSQWWSDAAPGNPRAPFDQDFYLILNTAVGGNYTGCSSPGCITASFPEEFIIDYVRVYEDTDNVLPTVAITAPSSGGTLPAGDIGIVASASDPDGSIATVEFYDGFSYLGEDTAAPYEFVWPGVADGCYTIRARTIDNEGGTHTDTVDITVGTGCGQAPYLGAAFVLPTRIEAEDYDDGGDGVAYSDTDPSNNGGQYRPTEGVDIEVCTDVGGGFNVGWVAPGEYLEYTVNVPVSGLYFLDVRLASQDNGGIYRVLFNGTNVTGDQVFAATGGWQNWITRSHNVFLSAGLQTMRFEPATDGFNVNYFDVTAGATAVKPGTAERRFALHSSFPNPFETGTTLRFDLLRRGDVTLQIFDVAGRPVRTLLANEALDQGRHDAVWDGRDEAGRLAAAGVYFYRLQSGGESSTEKIVKLR